ncbi:MAG: rhodanese-like domain-containing protein [Pseudomonadota bacterium]
MNFFVDNIYNSLLLLVMLASGAALLIPCLRRSGEQVSTLQATQLINQGKTLLLDVRDSAAFANGHVREARNIPLKELPRRLAELDKFKNKNVIVVCASGLQSSRATGLLRDAGFATVMSLSGGLNAWQAQGLPVARQPVVS